MYYYEEERGLFLEKMKLDLSKVYIEGMFIVVERFEVGRKRRGNVFGNDFIGSSSNKKRKYDVI